MVEFLILPNIMLEYNYYIRAYGFIEFMKWIDKYAANRELRKPIVYENRPDNLLWGMFFSQWHGK